MPALNAERTIAAAINSILTQTYENWELLVVVDALNEDRTYEIATTFEKNDKRVRVITNWKVAGVVDTRNLGNSWARGKYCIVQDADDYSFPDRLEKVVKCFKKTNADVIIHGAYINNWNQQYQCMERRYSPPLSGVADVLKNRINGWPAYKRGVWTKRPLREETRYAYDWMMHLDWTLSGFKYVTLDEGLYEYVRYQGSASDRFEKSGLRAQAFEKIGQIVKQEYGKKIKT